MNPNPKGARRSHKGLRLWTHARAVAALPYVVPVLRSLRDHWVEMRAQRRRARLLAQRPGRPDRTAMIALQEAQQEAQKAAAAYAEAQRELQALEITCIDPIRGQALFPFKHKSRLAWFLYDLFDEHPLRYWRYQDDPVETRRPVAVNEEEAGTSSAG
jgi:hypothetical protein